MGLEEKLSEEQEKKARQKTLEYFRGDELATESWISKYALKEIDKKTGKITFHEFSPDEMHIRIAEEIARIELKYPNALTKEQIYNSIKGFKYIIPQGGPMSGIGNNYQIGSLSNCFVIGEPEKNADSYGTIMKIDEEQVQLMKRRGGVGHDLSGLRPKDSYVQNSALTSTGIVPFMERYSNSTNEVAQEGRRGALMLSLDVRHADAERFIDAKLQEGKVTGANISIKLTDEFMYAAENDLEFTQQFPIDSPNPKFTKKIKAKDLWDKIIHNAWKKAEPGVLFWDTVIKESIPDCYADLGFKTVSTNPCGEIPLCPYDSCRLLAINLYDFVDNPFTPQAELNEKLFKEKVRVAQRISDDIIDLEIEKIDKILEKINRDPEDESIKAREKNLWEKIRETAVRGRRMGLGITGEGDMIAGMGLRYGSEEAIEFSTKVHKILAIEAYHSSVELAEERGKFEIYDAEREKDNPFIQRIKESDPILYEKMIKKGRRNIALLTIAPTGTVSIMTQTTSGIEPVFAVNYKRRRKINPSDVNTKIDETDAEGSNWKVYYVFHHKFENWLKLNGYKPEKIGELPEKELNEIIQKSPYYKATAMDLDWVSKVKMQGAIQKWVDHSISCTVNLPENATEKIVEQVYLTGWKEGCKGLTAYREGSRKGILQSEKKKENLEQKVVLVQNNVKPHPLLKIKPQAIKYSIKRVQNKDRLHVIPTSDLYVDDKNKKAYFLPDEDFQNRLPPGTATSVSFMMSGIDRSSILRGPDPDYVEFIEILQSAFSNEFEGIGPKQIKSIDHAVGIIWEDYLLRNGIIERDEITGNLIQKVRKKDLRKIDPKKDEQEYKAIMSQVRVGEGGELSVTGNNGRLDKPFSCKKCGSKEYTFSEGCNSPKCKNCGHDNGVGCG